MEIHIAREGKKFGPYSVAEVNDYLGTGFLKPDDSAWHEGMADWVPLHTVAGVNAPQGLKRPPPPTASMPLNVRTSGTAIASLVCGILSLVTGATALLGLPLGVLALIRIRNSKGEFTGSGLAIAGIACSCVGLITLAVVAGMMLPALSQAKNQAKNKAARIKCVNNLKQVGLAFRVFANDNDDKFPWRTNNFSEATANLPWQHFEAMSNELGSAKILMCPGDRQRLANIVMDFSATPGIGLLDRRNSAVSYTVGVNADETAPNVPLSHDRNVGYAESKSIKIAGYAEGLQQLHPAAYWVQGPKGDAAHHDQAGNMALSDGAVMQQPSAGLQQQLRMGADSLKRPSISMLFP